MPCPLGLSPSALSGFLSNAFEDLFLFCDRFGQIRAAALAVNRNHLFGSFYVQFSDPGACARCLRALEAEFFAGRRLKPRLVRFGLLRDAECRDDRRGRCANAACNFLHVHRDFELLRGLLAYSARSRVGE